MDGDFRLFEVRSDGFIRREHELLNQPVCDITRTAGYADHLAVRVELDDGFGQVEVDGAALHTFAIELQCELFHQLESLDESCVALPQAFVSFEKKVDVRIGHPFGTANDSARELLADYIALVVDLEDGRHTRRSTCGLREQSSVDSSTGSIGTARSGKYTLVPRFIASRSIGDPGRT